MTILPLAYLGNTEWFAHLTCGDCVIDIGENWIGQTARNRAEILTANGVAALTVPVHGGNGANPTKIRTKEIRIDYSKRWQHTHWVSMVSAYRNSPFFDHYEERFAPVYGKRFDFLVDLNLELLGLLISALRLDCAVEISDSYIVPSSGDLDLRGKKALRWVGTTMTELAARNVHRTGLPFGNADSGEYTQVFSDRMPFVAGLSVVDLLFCEGPSARDYLRRG